MGTTTFSGPIKAGTIRETTGTTLGTDITNTGYVHMVQSKSVALTGADANTDIGVLPAGSQIVNVYLDVITASDDSTASTISVGTAANGTAYIAATNALATSRTTPVAAALAGMADVGTSDSKVIAVWNAGSGDATVGEAIVTVQYVQNNNVT